MTTHKNGLLRVFWPSDAPRHEISGVLVGWRNSELDVLVVGVLQGVDARNVDHALRMRQLFRNSPHPLEHIWDRCGKQPIQVLGTMNASHRSDSFDPKMLSMHSVSRRKMPVIDCPPDSGYAIQIIIFDRPSPIRLQYFSLKAISLALGDKRGAFGSVPPFDKIDQEEEAERKRVEQLVDKLKMHTVIKHPRTEKELALGQIINQINCSAELNELMQSNIGLVGVRQKRALSVSERVVESATNLWELAIIETKAFLRHHVWPLASRIFVLVLMATRIGAEGLIMLLDWRPLPNSSAALKDISALAQQTDIRLQQFSYWPSQYLTLQRRRNDWESITTSHTEYIRFFNSIWLVANDIIIGIAIAAFLLDGENADYVAHALNGVISTYFVDGLKSMIHWLMGWPAGLKLNNELAEFLGRLFIWVIDGYEENGMRQLRPILPHLVRFIGVSSFAGASLPISMVSDLLSLLTLHIHCFYIASARIYHWQLTIIISLFHLFRGKKHNVLRNRIDSQNYDLDQLLLGTILFTLLFFLLPTVAVFYIAFAGARMGIIALKASLDTWLACLNHFPLFALMLRVKDSRRLPGGIRFELQDTPSSALRSLHSSDKTPVPPSAPISYIKLKPVPLPLSLIFSQYAQLGHRLRKHYLSSRVFLCLVSGQFVPPIHRKNLYSMQYSMLPVQRVGVTELWHLLTDDASASVIDQASMAAGGGGGLSVPPGVMSGGGAGMANGGLNGSVHRDVKKGGGANGAVHLGRSKGHQGNWWRR